MLRDGEAVLYNPFVKKMREAAKGRRDMTLRKSGKAVVKQQAACRHCGRLFWASRGVKIHESRFKSGPPATKTKSKPPPSSSQFSSMNQLRAKTLNTVYKKNLVA